MAFVEQLLATASSTELLPYYLLPKYCSLKPGESDERSGGGIAVRIIEQVFWTGLWFCFLFFYFFFICLQAVVGCSLLIMMMTQANGSGIETCLKIIEGISCLI